MIVVEKKNIYNNKLDDRMLYVAQCVEKWAKIFKFDDDIAIRIRLVTSDEDYKAEMDYSKGEYMSYIISFTERAILGKKKDIESDVIHEMLHVFLHLHLARSLRAAMDDRLAELYNVNEETIVTRLSYILMRGYVDSRYMEL